MYDSPQPTTPQHALVVIMWLIVLWMIAYTSLALYCILDLWISPSHVLCRVFAIADCSKFPPSATSAAHAILGGIIGAGVLGMVSFHKHVSLQQSFNLAHGWGYLFAPLLGALLGLIVFALVQSGLLVFSGTAQLDKPSFVANLGYISVGFLAGFGWYQATQGIDRIVKRFFSGEDTRATPPPATQEAEPAPAAPTEVEAKEPGPTPPNVTKIAPR